MHYHISYFIKHAELDDFQNGCNSETTQFSTVEINFDAPTKEGMINTLCAFFSLKPEDFELNACEENGRIDFSIYEDDDGNQIYDLTDFRAGIENAWLCNYSGYLQKVTVEKW